MRIFGEAQSNGWRLHQFVIHAANKLGGSFDEKNIRRSTAITVLDGRATSKRRSDFAGRRYTAWTGRILWITLKLLQFWPPWRACSAKRCDEAKFIDMLVP